MTLLRHDGTFEGFLTCLDRALRASPAEYRIIAGLDAGALSFDECVEVATDVACAESLKSRLAKVCGAEPLRTLALGFLAHDDRRDETLTEFARAAVRWGRATPDHLEHPAVLGAQRLAEGPLREAHKFKGILRFRELRDRTLYAPCEPKHHILPLLAGHFAARLAGLNWVIHDLPRGLALYHRQGETDLVAIGFAPDTPALPEPPTAAREAAPSGPAPDSARPQGSSSDLSQRVELLSEEEALYQELWKVYYSTIAIRQRTNPRLQMSHLPKRTWKHLVETPGRPFRR